jgi:drug/metabolite transporter (DMT)-like permease
LSGGFRFLNPYQILIGVVVGIGTILYYQGIRLIKAAQVSALELSTPFYAALLGVLILKEYPTPMQVIGVFFLFAGIVFLMRKEKNDH